MVVGIESLILLMTRSQRGDKMIRFAIIITLHLPIFIAGCIALLPLIPH